MEQHSKDSNDQSFQGIEIAESLRAGKSLLSATTCVTSENPQPSNDPSFQGIEIAESLGAGKSSLSATTYVTSETSQPSNDPSFQGIEIAESLGAGKSSLSATTYVTSVTSQPSNDPSFQGIEIAESLGACGPPPNKKNHIDLTDNSRNGSGCGTSRQSMSIIPSTQSNVGKGNACRVARPNFLSSQSQSSSEGLTHRKINHLISGGSNKRLSSTQNNMRRDSGSKKCDTVSIGRKKMVQPKLSFGNDTVGLTEESALNVSEATEKDSEAAVDDMYCDDPSEQGTVLAASHSHVFTPAPPPPVFSHKSAKSTIWNYFKKDSVNKCSTCLVCNQKTLSTTNATNAKRHLKICDEKLWKLVTEQDSHVSKIKTKASQPVILDSLIKRYDQKCAKQQRFRKSLAVFVGTCSASNSLPQMTEFKDMIAVCDPKIVVPSHPTINLDMQNVFEEDQKILGISLQHVRRLTLSSDIWSKKGFSSSYLGVTATFYHPHLKKKIQVVLGVQKFETATHKAEDVRREMKKVISRYGIKPNQIWRAMTDGGSNMVCSHQKINYLFSNSDTIFQELELDDSDSEDLFNDEIVGQDDTDGVTPKSDTDTGYRHLTCFVHTIINCLKLIELDPLLESIINPVRDLVAKFNKSSVLTADLINAAGVKLISFIDTRWNYIYHVLERILRVKPTLEEVLKKHHKTKYIFTEKQWDQIQELVTFLQLFDQHTNMSARERSIVSSEVCPTIITLYDHLDKYEKHPFLDNLASKIKMKMKQKFSHYFHKKDMMFDGTYLVATLLDPRYRAILPEDQQRLAKEFLMEEQQKFSVTTPVNTDIDITVETNNLVKKAKFPLVQLIKQNLRTQTQKKDSSMEMLSNELARYLQNTDYDLMEEEDDVYAFWQDRIFEYPALADIALDYLSIPDSTADVERVFTYGGILANGRRNRLEGNNLEREIFISKSHKTITMLKRELEKRSTTSELKEKVANEKDPG